MDSNYNTNKLPRIVIDKENDFATITIKEGVEAKSYMKNGFILGEDANGDLIEIQILNLQEHFNKILIAS
jgi:hypothetical protein